MIGFIVERQEPGDTTWQNIGTTTGGSFTDNMVQGETTYSYCLVATNAAGGSMPGSVATVQTGLLPPTGLQATVLAANQVVLDWSDATAPVTDSRSSSPRPPVIHPPGRCGLSFRGPRRFDLDGHLRHVRRWPELLFCNLQGGASSALSVPTHVTIPNLPAAPANLSAVWDGNAFRLTWTNHAADVQESDFTCVTPYGTETFPVYGSAEEYDLTDFSLIGLTGQPYPGDYQFSIQSRTAGGVSASTTAQQPAIIPAGLPTGISEYVSAVHGRATLLDFRSDWINPRHLSSQYDTLSVANISIPANGSVLASGDTITYTSNVAYVGTDTFTYQITNGQTVSKPMTVTVNVTDTAPVAYTDTDAVPTSGQLFAS